MVGFLEEIAKTSGIDMGVLSGEARVLYVGGMVVLVEGKTKLVEMTSEIVKIKLKKGMAIIIGKGLKLRNLNMQSVLVVGDISHFEIC